MEYQEYLKMRYVRYDEGLLDEYPDGYLDYLEHYEKANVYKLRIGDYRALIDVDKSRKILFVQVIDKRSRIYKRF